MAVVLAVLLSVAELVELLELLLLIAVLELLLVLALLPVVMLLAELPLLLAEFGWDLWSLSLSLSLSFFFEKVLESSDFVLESLCLNPFIILSILSKI